VANATPKQAIFDKMTYVAASDKVTEKVQIKKNSPQVKMEVGISEKLMLKLRRAQDLVSQKKRSSVSLELTLEALVDDYIKKYDPLEKATRQKIRGRLKSKTEQVLRTAIQVIEPENQNDEKNSQVSFTNPITSSRRGTYLNFNKSERISRPQSRFKRKALPSSLKHQVYLRNNGQCSATDNMGKRCGSQRFLDIHHLKPISQGGIDELKNLTLLCTGHHKLIHDPLL
jgi:5-methylcytosine-specific restriction endonuclease McrA